MNIKNLIFGRFKFNQNSYFDSLGRYPLFIKTCYPPLHAKISQKCFSQYSTSSQRGNRRENVFFTKKDRQFYLDLLETYCQQWQVDIFAYCLMSNHIHLVLTPKTEDGLQRVLKPLHMRYAQRINNSD